MKCRVGVSSGVLNGAKAHATCTEGNTLTLDGVTCHTGYWDQSTYFEVIFWNYILYVFCSCLISATLNNFEE